MTEPLPYFETVRITVFDDAARPVEGRDNYYVLEHSADDIELLAALPAKDYAERVQRVRDTSDPRLLVDPDGELPARRFSVVALAAQLHYVDEGWLDALPPNRSFSAHLNRRDPLENPKDPATARLLGFFRSMALIERERAAAEAAARSAGADVAGPEGGDADHRQ